MVGDTAPVHGSDARVFSPHRVVRLTGLTDRQLRYWDSKGFVTPAIRVRRGRGVRRLYDFRDLVALRVAADLRENQVPLQKIRAVVDHLRDLDYVHPLAELRFWSEGGRIFFAESGTVREGHRPDQTTVDLRVPFGEVVSTLEAKIHELNQRRIGTTERRRGKLGSQLVIAGTRIPVATIRRLNADGVGPDEILTMYPDLTAADIHAALREEDGSTSRQAI